MHSFVENLLEPFEISTVKGPSHHHFDVSERAHSQQHFANLEQIGPKFDDSFAEGRSQIALDLQCSQVPQQSRLESSRSRREEFEL